MQVGRKIIGALMAGARLDNDVEVRASRFVLLLVFIRRENSPSFGW